MAERALRSCDEVTGQKASAGDAVTADTVRRILSHDVIVLFVERDLITD